MGRLRRSEQGSVSIYLLIIFISVFFLNAVLIDYARIIIAKKETEAAVRTAVRSVLAGFDPTLYSGFGIYGLTEEDQQELFLDVVNRNLDTEDEYFHLVQPQVSNETAVLEHKYPLSDHTVFKRQILEEMKYKAPVNFTIDLIDRFKNLSFVMEEAVKTTDTLQDIQKDYEKRQEIISEIFKLQEQSAELVKKREEKKFDKLEELVADYKSYLQNVDKLKNDENLSAEEKKVLRKKINSYEEKFDTESKAVYSDYASVLKEHQLKLESAEEKLQKAKILNQKIKDRIEEAEQDERTYYKKVGETSSSPNEKENENELKDILNRVRDYKDIVLSEEFFHSFQQDIENQAQKYADLVKEMEGLKNWKGKKEKDLKQNIKRIKEIFKDYSTSYIEPNNRISEKKNEIKELQKELDKDLKKVQEDQAEVKLEEIQNLFEDLKKIKGYDQQFDQLESFYKRYVSLNDPNLKESDTVDNRVDQTPDEEVEEAMVQTDTLFKNLAKILEEIRDEIYLNEYAFERFQNFDPTLLKDFNKDNQKIELLDLRHQEVEYILYGFHSPGSNIAAAFTEIFLLRLAINTMEGLIEVSKTVKHPIAIMIGAVLYGIAASVQDIYDMINGKVVYLSKKVAKIPFSYQDYLRLFLFLHHDDIKKPSRMQALIQLKTGLDLQKSYTYIDGSVDATIRLWFLPGVMKSLQVVGILDGKVSDGRYQMRKKAVMAY